MDVQNVLCMNGGGRGGMDVQKVLCMNGGDGETSYAKNSSIQREIIGAARSVMKEALLDLYHATGFPGNLTVADLGCSSGPNVLSVVADVVDTVEERCRQLGRSPPEFQLFLNDLPGNDFNSVFRSLEAFHEERKRGKESRCFVAGVPGSFHGRLFPSRSIHFFHSSSSLHWLSQVPWKLQQHEVPFNKGNIYISKGSPPSVVHAYAVQFRKDLSTFLRCRAEEMVVGGRMVLILVGRKTLDPTTEEATFQWNILTRAFMDMVEKGYIAEEKVDYFNAPFYSPCAVEVENEVRMEGSFSMKRLQIFEVPWEACQEGRGDGGGGHRPGESNGGGGVFLPHQMTRGQSMANCARAAVESMVASHFGGDIADSLFLRYGEVLEEYLSTRKPTLTNMAMSLVRKT